MRSFAVRYQDISHVQSIVDGIKSYMVKHSQIDNNQIMFTLLDEYMESCIRIRIVCCCTATGAEDFMNFKHAMMLEVGAIVAKRGAEFAYPVRELLIDKKSCKSLDKDAN